MKEYLRSSRGLSLFTVRLLLTAWEGGVCRKYTNILIFEFTPRHHVRYQTCKIQQIPCTLLSTVRKSHIHCHRGNMGFSHCVGVYMDYIHCHTVNIGFLLWYMRFTLYHIPQPHSEENPYTLWDSGIWKLPSSIYHSVVADMMLWCKSIIPPPTCDISVQRAIYIRTNHSWKVDTLTCGSGIYFSFMVSPQVYGSLNWDTTRGRWDY